MRKLSRLYDIGKIRADPPYTQSRAPETPGAPCSQELLILNLASGYENMNDHLFYCGALSRSLALWHAKSCNVNVLQSLALNKTIS